MVNILIARHGETNSNKEKIMMGQSHTPLNSSGINQARKLGQFLSSQYKISKIFSSDLTRAVQTTERILDYFDNKLPVTYTSDLRERNSGKKFVGRPYHEFDTYFRDGPNGEFNIHKKEEDGESAVEFYQRVKVGIEKIFHSLEQAPNHDTILMVSHGGTIRVLLGYLFLERNLNRTCLYNYFPTDIMNCSITGIGFKNKSESDGPASPKTISLRYVNFYQYQDYIQLQK